MLNKDIKKVYLEFLQDIVRANDYVDYYYDHFIENVIKSSHCDEFELRKDLAEYNKKLIIVERGD
jgi:hypothetical protein